MRVPNKYIEQQLKLRVNNDIAQKWALNCAYFMRNLFDPYSTEWACTSIEEKIKLLRCLEKVDLLDNVLGEHLRFFHSDGRPDILQSVCEAAKEYGEQGFRLKIPLGPPLFVYPIALYIVGILRIIEEGKLDRNPWFWLQAELRRHSRRRSHRHQQPRSDLDRLFTRHLRTEIKNTGPHITPFMAPHDDVSKVNVNQDSLQNTARKIRRKSPVHPLPSAFHANVEKGDWSDPMKLGDIARLLYPGSKKNDHPTRTLQPMIKDGTIKKYGGKLFVLRLDGLSPHKRKRFCTE